MANFVTHVIGATLVTSICVGGTLLLDLVSPLTALAYFGLGVVGGILPDIDADKSIPVRMGFAILGLLLATSSVMLAKNLYPWAILLGIWILIFLGIRYVLYFVFNQFTVHRGLFHSIPCAILTGLLIVTASYYVFTLSAEMSWFAGCFIFLGFMTHLCLDELYSVDLFNARIKKSFGTALKFGSRANLTGTLVLYLVIAGLSYYSPPYELFVHRVFSQKNLYKIQAQVKNFFDRCQ